MTFVEFKAVAAGWPKASLFNSVVDQQWQRIHTERFDA